MSASDYYAEKAARAKQLAQQIEQARQAGDAELVRKLQRLLEFARYTGD